MMPQPKTPRDAAVRILESLKATYAAPLDFVCVPDAEFTHLDLPAYAEIRTWAASCGFNYLADLEFPALTNNPTTVIARAMVRTHLSVDGATGMEYYQVKPRMDRVLQKLCAGLLNLRWIDTPRWVLGMLKTKHCVSFVTEFEDGNFVVTSNAQSAGILKSPPTIDAVFKPYSTAPRELLEEHRRRVQLKLSKLPACAVVVVKDLAGLREQQQRLSEQKRAYRAAQDWISKAELAAMSSNRGLADAVYAELQKLQSGSGRPVPPEAN